METKFFVSALNRGEENTITMRYSVTAIMLRYILALLHNALGLCRKVIAFKSYRFWQIEAVIATFSYRFGNILTVIALKSYCSASKAKAITCNAVTFWSNVADLCPKVKELRRLTKNACCWFTQLQQHGTYTE
jgi:hypothetical protein